MRPRQKSMGVPKVGHKLFLSLFQPRVDYRLPRRFTGPAGPDIKNIYYGTLCKPTGRGSSVSAIVIRRLILLAILTSNVIQ